MSELEQARKMSQYEIELKLDRMTQRAFPKEFVLCWIRTDQILILLGLLRSMPFCFRTNIGLLLMVEFHWINYWKEMNTNTLNGYELRVEARNCINYLSLL